MRTIVKKAGFLLITLCWIFISFSSLSLAQNEDFDPYDEEYTSGAQEGTVLPGTDRAQSECEKIMRSVNRHYEEARESVAYGNEFYVDDLSDVYGNDILACGIKTGDIKLWMVPFYVRFVLEFVIGLAGLLSVAGIIYGSYLYLVAGISEDKEKGKNALKNSIIGLIITLTAWGFVNIVIALVSG